jgi:hypothetical protein
MFLNINYKFLAMKKLFKMFVFVIPISLLVASCYPGFDATVEELDIAITKYDSTQDFSQLKSFFLQDTVVCVGEEDDNGDRCLDNATQALILSEIRTNLTGLGWTEVTDTVGGIESDVAIMVTALQTDVYSYYYYWWDYWYWYPWYGWDPWYPGYPIYPIYPTYPTYSYSAGTVLMDMVNMNKLDLPHNPDTPSGKVPIVWSGAINGVLAGGNSTNRITTQIEQVFKQSTYLKK